MPDCVIPDFLEQFIKPVSDVLLATILIVMHIQNNKPMVEFMQSKLSLGLNLAEKTQIFNKDDNFTYRMMIG